jgi:signal transduction histidine kinase
MRITIQTKIWLTVLCIVLMFTYFTLYYFPAQQKRLLLKNYNTEVQNLANTVALGVKIALTEQNYNGLDSAMKFVTTDPRLKFVSTVQYDTAWSDDHQSFKIEKTIFKTFPETEHPEPNVQSGSSIIVKRGNFDTPIMSGVILLAFATKEINESQKEIRHDSLMVSALVLLIGILLGLLLARKISIPLMALRDAANRVGEGDLTQKVKQISNDEIGELGKAFNHMVDDLLKTRRELRENNQELSATNSRLNAALLELKSTQAQLIQSEKMASLGELTAGIAHEIQNPLNFVNNFSEVNKELLEELKTERMQPTAKRNEQMEDEIIDDVIDNSEKINHHGKRAGEIVKGMLQHSQKSKGQKEPTNINKLADEYLRLSYHGLRAKDKNFNATMKTDFDESIGKINIVPQDIGRVLLNLFNNAFYACTERSRSAVNEQKSKNLISYEPTVTVTTKKVNDKVEIRVSDNGNGISQNIVDKIFQPFFTTKPTGQGTGLGLSLSYDIVKAHGGEIKVESKEGEGSEFIIHLNI